MTPNFYLPRKLYDHEKEYTELEVIEAFQIIIILAEPGAGKSSLLENFSSHLSIKRKQLIYLTVEIIMINIQF